MWKNLSINWKQSDSIFHFGTFSSYEVIVKLMKFSKFIIRPTVSPLHNVVERLIQIDKRLWFDFLQMSLKLKSPSNSNDGAGASHATSRSNSTRAPKTSSKEDFTFKLVMVGDSGVGKSCLLEKFLDLSSNNAFISTIGYEVRTHIIKLDGQTVKLQVRNWKYVIFFSHYVLSWVYYFVSKLLSLPH